MIDKPQAACGRPLLRRAAACVVSAACAVLAACGGGATEPSAAATSSPAPAAVLQQAVVAPGHALAGQTSVVLNPSVAPGATVAVARDADGTLRLLQRDGTVRELAPDGTMKIRSGGAPAAMQGELPASVMVAVDASNRVHVVDPDACMTRTISPEGRVATTVLPKPRPGAACPSRQASPP